MNSPPDLCARCGAPLGLTTVDAYDADGTVSWCCLGCAEAHGYPVPDLRAIRARLSQLQLKAPPMPRTPPAPSGRHLLVTVRLPLPEDVFAEAEAIAEAAGPIRALKEALGEHATVAHVVETTRAARKPRATKPVAVPDGSLRVSGAAA